MTRKVLIGEVGVDSGQVMITDPCYVKDFKNDEPFLQENELSNGDNFAYSYSGCCDATCNAPHHGQLDYALGHPGAGVVSTTAYGDGVYPVYAEIEDNGTIAALIVEFIGPEDY